MLNFIFVNEFFTHKI